MPRRAPLDIETYNRKRDFSKTKEPKGRKLKGKGDSFVVQKHDASRLHWDLHLALDGDRMKGEWVMFRLKPRPGEKAEPWMLKKVTDDFAEPDDGDALVDNCVTSVTTGRTMAEIAAGEDVWRSNRGGQKGGRARRKASKAPPPFQEP